jgi:hypothetical protein
VIFVLLEEKIITHEQKLIHLKAASIAYSQNQTFYHHLLYLFAASDAGIIHPRPLTSPRDCESFRELLQASASHLKNDCGVDLDIQVMVYESSLVFSKDGFRIGSLCLDLHRGNRPTFELAGFYYYHRKAVGNEHLFQRLAHLDAIKSHRPIYWKFKKTIKSTFGLDGCPLYEERRSRSFFDLDLDELLHLSWRRYETCRRFLTLETSLLETINKLRRFLIDIGIIYEDGWENGINRDVNYRLY